MRFAEGGVHRDAEERALSRGATMDLKGLRVLIVEDEPFLQLELVDILEECGCHIAGTAGRVESALRLVQEADFDFALLDMNLAGAKVDPVVAALETKRVPYLFLTGYGKDGLTGRQKDLAVEKPYDRKRLIQTIERVMRDDEGRGN